MFNKEEKRPKEVLVQDHLLITLESAYPNILPMEDLAEYGKHYDIWGLAWNIQIKQCMGKFKIIISMRPLVLKMLYLCQLDKLV